MNTTLFNLDASLMNEIMNNNERSFLKLYNRMKDYIYGLALQVVGNVTDAEEVVQQTFLKIWDNAKTYDSTKAKVSSWLTAIAKRQALDKRRSKLFRARNSELAVDTADVDRLIADPHRNSLESMIKKDDIKIVSEILNNLPEANRKLIELAYYGGYSHAQIAERVNTPLGTVKTKLRRSVLEVRKQLKNRL